MCIHSYCTFQVSMLVIDIGWSRFSLGASCRLWLRCRISLLHKTPLCLCPNSVIWVVLSSVSFFQDKPFNGGLPTQRFDPVVFVEVSGLQDPLTGGVSSHTLSVVVVIFRRSCVLPTIEPITKSNFLSLRQLPWVVSGLYHPNFLLEELLSKALWASSIYRLQCSGWVGKVSSIHLQQLCTTWRYYIYTGLVVEWLCIWRNQSITPFFT